MINYFISPAFFRSSLLLSYSWIYCCMFPCFQLLFAKILIADLRLMFPPFLAPFHSCPFHGFPALCFPRFQLPFSSLSAILFADLMLYVRVFSSTKLLFYLKIYCCMFPRFHLCFATILLAYLQFYAPRVIGSTLLLKGTVSRKLTPMLLYIIRKLSL